MELMQIQQKIYEVRGLKVMLDFDLAEMFEVETKSLNQAIKRNAARFPNDFMFRLSRKEWADLKLMIRDELTNRSQIVTGSQKHRENQPLAFTEHGVTMLASVLRSERAVQMNIAIVRAFIAMRNWAFSYKELAERIEAMDKENKAQFADIYEALKYLMDDKEVRKQAEEEWKHRKRIGFKKED